MNLFKRITIILCIVCMMCPAVKVYANNRDIIDTESAILNYSVSDEIGFALYKVPDNTEIEDQISLAASKKYTQASYEGYFYHTNNNKKISKYVFTAKFSYDGTMVTCYDTNSSIVMVENDSNLRPKAENEGRNNLTPTQAYGYVTFVLYRTNNSVSTEASIKIYCNQNGNTWVNRQG